MDEKHFLPGQPPKELQEQHHRPFCWIRVNQYLEFLIRSSLNAQTPSPVNYNINIHPHKNECNNHALIGTKDSQPSFNNVNLENKNHEQPFIFKRPKTPPVKNNI